MPTVTSNFSLGIYYYYFLCDAITSGLCTEMEVNFVLEKLSNFGFFVDKHEQ